MKINRDVVIRKIAGNAKPDILPCRCYCIGRFFPFLRKRRIYDDLGYRFRNWTQYFFLILNYEKFRDKNAGGEFHESLS